MKTWLLYLTPQQFCDATNACPEGTKFALRYETMSEVWDALAKDENRRWLAFIILALECVTKEELAIMDAEGETNLVKFRIRHLSTPTATISWCCEEVNYARLFNPFKTHAKSSN